MSEYYKEINLEGFGYKELSDIAELLESFSSGDHLGNISEPIRIGFNLNSGNVFIIDYDEQVWMMNDDELEPFYCCSNCGKEGFKEDFQGDNEDSNCSECSEYVPYDQ